MIACQRQLQIICEVLVMKMDVFKTLLLTRGCRYLHTFPRTIVLSTTMQSKVMDNSGIKKVFACVEVSKIPFTRQCFFYKASSDFVHPLHIRSAH